MLRNKLLLLLLSFSFVISCATTDDVPPEEEQGQIAEGISEPSEGVIDSVESESPGVSSELPDEEDDAVEELSEPALPIAENLKEITSVPSKESRTGGKKPPRPETDANAVVSESETEAAAPAEPILTEELPEEPVSEDETIIPNEETGQLSSVDTVEDPEEQSIEESEEEMGEDDFAVTVITETNDSIEFSDIYSELPSERDEIEYNPLLPVVVDSSTTVSDSEGASEESDEEAPDSADYSSLSFADAPGIETESPVEEGSRSRGTDLLDSGSVESRSAAVEVDASSGGIVSGESADVPSDIEGEELQDLYLDSSGKLIIELQGTGWIYLPSDDNQDLRLKDKSYNPDGGTTRFVFTTAAAPDGRILFLKQDLLRGESSQKSLDLSELRNDTMGDEAAAVEDGAFEESGISLISETGSGSGEEMEPQKDSFPDKAPEEGNSAVSAQTTSLEDSSIDSGEETVLPGDAAGLLRLAEKYEAAGPGQSLEKALELYYRIKREFPVTEERFIAETRIRYLNKHYFKVQ